MADLLIRNARLVATVDAQRRELAGGWVAITGATSWPGGGTAGAAAAGPWSTKTSLCDCALPCGRTMQITSALPSCCRT